jgi:hypothetical protein
MNRRKQYVPERPRGCRKCQGQPWVEAKGGMRRCTCPSGVWYQQRDRERQQKLASLPMEGLWQS